MIVNHSNKILLPFEFLQNESLKNTPIINDAQVTLGKFIFLNPQIFNGMSVLDMEAGIGFAGVILSKYTKARSIILAESSEMGISNLKTNIIKNKANRITVVQLHWNNCHLHAQKYGVLLVSDPFKNGCSPEQLLKAVNHFLGEKGILILVAPNNEKLQHLFLELVNSNMFLIHHHELRGNKEYVSSPLIDKSLGESLFPELKQGLIQIYEIVKKSTQQGNE